MIDLFLPLVFGLFLGIDLPVKPDADIAEPQAQLAQELAADLGSGDALSAMRDPEPQVPTGRFTTAVEVRPILSATKPNWIGVREFNGQDLVYFTQLMAWRCGLWDIRFGINGAPADTVVPMEPCYTDQPQPNALRDVEMFLPYVVFPLGVVETVTVEIVFDDATRDAAEYDRAAVRIP